MVTSVAQAVSLVTAICRAGPATAFSDDTSTLAADGGLVDAVRSHDTSFLYGWLMEAFSFQGVSDRVAASYIEAHGNASWDFVDASLRATSCECPKLGSFANYRGCRFRKTSGSCAEPTHIANCPVPLLPLRKGDLNQMAYSLYYFLADRCGGDLVAFIDQLFESAGSGIPDEPDLVNARRAALIAELSGIFAVSDKLIGMTFAVLLMGGDPSRADWIAVGRSFVAIDSLVHNFLHRTGILAAYGRDHLYGDRCFGNAGCASVVYDLARRIDARRFNPGFPQTFPRLIQFAIWSFCAEAQANVCNGRHIDDHFACARTDCPVGKKCSRIPLRPSAPP